MPIFYVTREEMALLSAQDVRATEQQGHTFEIVASVAEAEARALADLEEADPEAEHAGFGQPGDVPRATGGAEGTVADRMAADIRSIAEDSRKQTELLVFLVTELTGVEVETSDPGHDADLSQGRALSDANDPADPDETAEMDKGTTLVFQARTDPTTPRTRRKSTKATRLLHFRRRDEARDSVSDEASDAANDAANDAAKEAARDDSSRDSSDEARAEDGAAPDQDKDAEA